MIKIIKMLKEIKNQYDDNQLQEFKAASEEVYKKSGDVAGKRTVDKVRRLSAATRSRAVP